MDMKHVEFWIFIIVGLVFAYLGYSALAYH